jgi:Na+-driven multidrug efflux pump
MSATTALVGRSVGQRDAAGAADWVRRLTRAGVYTALAFGGLMALSAAAVPTLFANAGTTVQALAIAGILINAAAQVVKVRNMILGAGVLPSGADVRGVIMGDAISTFAVGIPLALVLALATPLGLIGLFLARVIEELVKLAIFEYRARRISWRAVIERDTAALTPA